jgi:drug/metabolite transporter (DMT)-like permease
MNAPTDPPASVRVRSPRVSRAELALIAITAVWGSTFLVVHDAVRHAGPLTFVAARFLVAGLIAGVCFARAMPRLTRLEAAVGLAVGTSIFLGYGLQTIGLQTIPSSTSAFLTALYVPMVPLLQWGVFRQAPPLMAWVGVALAFAGLVLLAGPGALRLDLGRGELITLASTLPIAAEILLIGRFTSTVDVGRVTVVQLLTAGLLSLTLVPIAGERMAAASASWLVPAVALGAASVVIQVTMNWAQRTVSPTRATVIYAGEPVWGGVVGRIDGDRFPAASIIGATLIVAGVIASELKPRRAGARSTAPANRGGD